MNLKKVATVGVIILLMFSAMFFLIYQEYTYTYIREERVNGAFEVAERELNRSIYNTIKRDSQTKVDRVAREIRENLVENYDGDLSRFADEYDNPTEDTILIQTIDDAISSEENRYFYVESDANDMFVLSTYGVIADKSQDCSSKGADRPFENEIPNHFNKPLAEEAIRSMVVGDKQDMFWRFKNTQNDKAIAIDKMDIQTLLELPMEDLKDYECLSTAYIDKHGDILGKEDVGTTGVRQNSRKLVIVQGFDLHEQISQDFSESYKRLAKNKVLQIAIIEESRNWLRVKIVITMIILIIGLFAVSAMQDLFVKGCEEDDKFR